MQHWVLIEIGPVIKRRWKSKQLLKQQRRMPKNFDACEKVEWQCLSDMRERTTETEDQSSEKVEIYG